MNAIGQAARAQRRWRADRVVAEVTHGYQLVESVLRTVDTETKEETVSFKERTDVTAVPAMGVVAETMMALVVAGEALRKFGGDSLPEVLRNQAAYLDSLRST